MFHNLLILFIAMLPVLATAQEHVDAFQVATYNIRYDAKEDTANRWDTRKHEIQKLLLYHQVDIVGIQEGLHHQVEDLDNFLPHHSFVGAGRDDGAKKGEYSALYFDNRRFALQKSGTFWLSKTPDKPSKDWDAALPRVCTWALLKDKQNGKMVYVFNTHFDHIGKIARVNSARLIHEKISTIANNAPVILMGDFNVEPASDVYGVLQTNNMKDAMHLSVIPHFGPEATFNGFNFIEVPQRRIDFIFVSPSIRVLRHSITNHHYNLKYPSDHFPVLSEVVIQ